MLINYRFAAVLTIGQGKRFYWQIIPQPSCTFQETVGIEILTTSKNGDKGLCNQFREKEGLPREPLGGSKVNSAFYSSKAK